MFLFGLLGFFALHLLPFFPQYREQAVEKVGSEGLYKIILAVVSLILLLIMGIGKGSAGYVLLWDPHVSLRYLSLPVIYASFVLILSAYLPNNIPRFVPHPMLTGVIVWATMHIITNGDLVSIIMFLSFIGYSVFAIIQIDKRDAANEHEKELRVFPIMRDGIVLGVALGGFLLMWLLHGALFARPIFPAY
ncbi:MAG: NnrU family protein [Candidatus Eutrophobiaceae bacterium]